MSAQMPLSILRLVTHTHLAALRVDIRVSRLACHPSAVVTGREPPASPATVTHWPASGPIPAAAGRLASNQSPVSCRSRATRAPVTQSRTARPWWLTTSINRGTANPTSVKPPIARSATLRHGDSTAQSSLPAHRPTYSAASRWFWSRSGSCRPLLRSGCQLCLCVLVELDVGGRDVLFQVPHR